MNTLQRKNVLLFSAVTLCGLLVLLAFGATRAHGSQSNDQPTISNQYRTFDTLASTTASGATFISQPATTTNATSTNVTGLADGNGVIWNGAVNVAGAKKIDAYFTRGGAYAVSNTGTSTFALQGTPDGINWYYINRLLTSTSTQTSTFGAVNGVFASDPTLGSIVKIGATTAGNVATSTLHLSVDLSTVGFQAVRCIATITVDGANSCQIAVTF